VPQIGIVLSDFGTGACVFNKLVALFLQIFHLRGVVILAVANTTLGLCAARQPPRDSSLDTTTLSDAIFFFQ
jgi:hypothetical protein